MERFIIPQEVSRVTETLQKGGFEAYIVGGCVRDIIRGKEPKDWDVTTSATPAQIQALFTKTVYENAFGTVAVFNETENDKLKIIEVTPFRLEGKYSDNRHPDSVSFSTNLSDDLLRRDFTMNAIALDPSKGHIVDPLEGQKDIANGIIRAVGNPHDRFSEDALRTLRAVRFASELGFTIEQKTGEGLQATAHLLSKISGERIRDELTKLIMSDNPMVGIILCQRYGILTHFLPEVEVGLGVEQNGDHIYDVWEHNLRALNHSAERNWPLHVRLSALFHDVAKPNTRVWSKEKGDWTFYGHDVVGGRITTTIMERLRFSKKMTETVAKLVRYHLFFSDIDKITLSAVRRLVRNVGPENVWDLMKLRACDRIGMGRPKETPYRLRKYESMIEEAMRAPVSVGMLKIDGARIMETAKIAPGPAIGFILHALLEEVLEKPELNTADYLESRAGELVKLPEAELRALGEAGKDKKEEIETKEIEVIRKRHHVK